MEAQFFERKKVVGEKALAFGFRPDGAELVYSRDFFGDDFAPKSASPPTER